MAENEILPAAAVPLAPVTAAHEVFARLVAKYREKSAEYLEDWQDWDSHDGHERCGQGIAYSDVADELEALLTATTPNEKGDSPTSGGRTEPAMSDDPIDMNGPDPADGDRSYEWCLDQARTGAPVDWPARFRAAADAAEKTDLNLAYVLAQTALAIEANEADPDTVEAIGRALLGGGQ